uniref:AP-3 complex subunit delta domain-containing protein n=1 Tax=Timema genevievae TaxID=629358 RepID=A0A7R9PH42_TIMGE|nr:unnamed protein product [Timema genevievae]
MALRKVKGNLERMFDKNLTDLVRGIRNNKDNEAKYIAQCIEEIKQELRQDNIAVKSNAVAKLTYLQMLGYDISWAGFNIIEVMSSSKFTYKRIGYLASSQCFHTDTELLMLTTNMIRKDLNSQNQYDAGLALSGLSCFISPDLARDLANDIMTLLTSTKPYLRKKAVLMMYKVFLRFPEALRPAFPRLKEKLEDPDSGVQSAAVNVVCELARKNPKNYLSLAPVFFKLMTSSTNNWMLIKIIKLFGALTPLEPRLGKKLIEPLTNLIHSTSAMSLLYECINTVIAVKYLGLLAMSKILKTHPKSVQAHKDLIMQCLDDKDESIRLRALDLLYGMVSKKNLMEIVKKLMVHMDKAEGTTYRDELLSKIIQICSQNNYQYITNFEWYVSVLVELTRMEGSQHGCLVATQMLDVAIRVQAIRQFAVQQMALLLDNAHFLTSGSAQRSTMSEVLYAAAWICGEFSEHLSDPQATLEAMLRGRVFTLPGHIQAVYVQNILKLFANILSTAEDQEDTDRINKLCEVVAECLPQFVSSADLEVQERASSALQLVRFLQKQTNKGDLGLAQEMAVLFVGELNPVAPKAQRKVQVPEGLDLDVWINDPPSESSEDEDQKISVGANDIFVKSDKDSYYNSNNHKKTELTEEEMEILREARKQERANNPHYLKSYQHSNNRTNSLSLDDYTEIPVAEIELPVSLQIPGKATKGRLIYCINNVHLTLLFSGLASSDKYYNLDLQSEKRQKKKKKRKGKKGGNEMVSSEEEGDTPVHVVNTDIGEMPEGAQLSDGDEHDSRPSDDPHKALDIDLDEPLRDEEKLPVRAHRLADFAPTTDLVVKEKTKKHRNKEKKAKDKTKGKSKEHRKHKNKQREPVTPDLKAPADDIDLWLSQDPSDYQQVGPSDYQQVASDGENSSVTRERPSLVGEEASTEQVPRKTKKDKKKTKDKEKKLSQKPKEGYEEAAGISTPSKEVITEMSLEGNMSPQSPLANYTRLANDKTLQLMYETRLLPHDTSRIVVSIMLSNQSPSLVKELDFSVSDTSSLKLIREDSDDQYNIKLHFHLTAHSSSEAQFAFMVSDVTFPQKMRGTLTYMVQTSDDMSAHEKLDFWLPIPVSSYMIGRLPHRDTVSELLSSGQLTDHASLHLEDVMDTDFSRLLSRVCLHCHFTLVEQVDKTASLYSHSIQDHHVCLLVKSGTSSGQLSIEGKSNCQLLLSNLLAEIKQLLSPRETT